MIKAVHILRTDVGDFPAPDYMIEAAKGVRFIKGWPDRRTKAGKHWIKLFKEFQDQKVKEWMAAA